MQSKSFSENVVIVTGASSGIGRQIAGQLADQGAWLSLAARNAGHLEEVAEECRRRGAKVIVTPADVSDKSQCRNLIDRTVKEYGRIDTLISNAGFAVASRFDEFRDLALFEKVFSVNFFGGVYCTYYALPFLKETKGRIVAVSSIRGRLPSSTADGYGASKHALTEFFSSLRNELNDSGVSVTIVYPNWVCTGITGRAVRADGTQKGEISVHEKNAMSPEKCAGIVVKAAACRKRDVVISFEGKIGSWLRLISPRLVDKILRSKTDQ